MPGQYVVNWTGGRIGLGASVFHFQGTDSPSAALAAANAIKAFFVSIQSNIPNTVNLTFDNEVTNLTAAGTLTSVVSITAPAGITGSGSGAWTNGVGAMVRWNTPAIVSGRRLLGRTYLVPLISSTFSGGNLVPATATSFQTGANTMVSALASNGTPLQIWSKAHAVTADVGAAVVPGRPATLRSRNDRD